MPSLSEQDRADLLASGLHPVWLCDRGPACRSCGGVLATFHDAEDSELRHRLGIEFKALGGYDHPGPSADEARELRAIGVTWQSPNVTEALLSLRASKEKASAKDERRRSCSKCGIDFEFGFTDGCSTCAARRRKAESRRRRGG